MIDCAYEEICKHKRGEDGEECEVRDLCKRYLSVKDAPAEPKKKRRGRPPKDPTE